MKKAHNILIIDEDYVENSLDFELEQAEQRIKRTEIDRQEEYSPLRRLSYSSDFPDQNKIRMVEELMLLHNEMEDEASIEMKKEGKHHKYTDPVERLRNYGLSIPKDFQKLIDRKRVISVKKNLNNIKKESNEKKQVELNYDKEMLLKHGFSLAGKRQVKRKKMITAKGFGSQKNLLQTMREHIKDV